MSGLPDAAADVVEQFRCLVVAVDRASGDLYSEAGIGRHLRHVIDHFRAFERGLESGIIDYNERSRQSPLEFDVAIALQELARLIGRLRDLPEANVPVTIVSEVCCTSTFNRRLAGTSDRELLFLVQHTVHHLAYAALLARQHGVIPDPWAGIAPATATYLRDKGLSAP